MQDLSCMLNFAKSSKLVSGASGAAVGGGVRVRDRGRIHSITPVVGWEGPWRCKGDSPPLGNTATGVEAIVDRLAAAGAAGAAVGSGDLLLLLAAACACSPCLSGGGLLCSSGTRGAASMTGGLRADALLELSNRGSRIGG